MLKYRKGDEDSLMEKISKLNIHSIIKKSSRVSSHLKHLTGFAPQVSPSLQAQPVFDSSAGPRGQLLAWVGLGPFLVPPLALPVSGDRALQLRSCL